MSYTYSDMQTRIADELARSDLTSNIQLAILSAIKNRERKRWAWNEVRDSTFLTVSAQSVYAASDNALIPNLVTIDTLKAALSVTSSKLELRKREFQWIDQQQANTTTSSYPPTDYCYHASSIIIYPTPNQAQTCYISGVYRLTALSAGSDTNGWTNDGEEMIRLAAKIDLFENVIRSETATAEAAMLRGRLGEVENNLMAELQQRDSGGRNAIRASYL